jgi:hypothetical protein
MCTAGKLARGSDKLSIRTGQWPRMPPTRPPTTPINPRHRLFPGPAKRRATRPTTPRPTIRRTNQKATRPVTRSGIRSATSYPRACWSASACTPATGWWSVTARAFPPEPARCPAPRPTPGPAPNRARRPDVPRGSAGPQDEADDTRTPAPACSAAGRCRPTARWPRRHPEPRPGPAAHRPRTGYAAGWTWSATPIRPVRRPASAPTRGSPAARRPSGTGGRHLSSGAGRSCVARGPTRSGSFGYRVLASTPGGGMPEPSETGRYGGQRRISNGSGARHDPVKRVPSF